MGQRVAVGRSCAGSALRPSSPRSSPHDSWSIARNGACARHVIEARERPRMSRSETRRSGCNGSTSGSAPWGLCGCAVLPMTGRRPVRTHPVLGRTGLSRPGAQHHPALRHGDLQPLRLPPSTRRTCGLGSPRRVLLAVGLPLSSWRRFCHGPADPRAGVFPRPEPSLDPSLPDRITQVGEHMNGIVRCVWVRNPHAGDSQPALSPTTSRNESKDDRGRQGVGSESKDKGCGSATEPAPLGTLKRTPRHSGTGRESAGGAGPHTCRARVVGIEAPDRGTSSPPRRH
jgi:hypothetical protein